MQCQTVYRNALKSSPNKNIQSLWKNTSQSMNIQYDVYRNTREVLKAVRSDHKKRLQNHLVSQGTVLSFIFDHSLPLASKIWTTVQSYMPKNIYSFTIKYLSNSLATQKNLSKWNITQSSDCSFCHIPETLIHIVAGCKTYLEEGRYTWHHNSALNFLAQSLKAIPNSFFYAYLSGYLSPSIVTGDSFRPDLLLVTSDHRLFILELTVGYETNLDVNANRKREKYSNLIHSLSGAYSSIMFVNLSISSLGIFGLSCSSFIDMCNALDIS